MLNRALWCEHIRDCSALVPVIERHGIKRITLCKPTPPNAGVLEAPNAEPPLAAPPKLKGELAAGVDAAPNRPPPVAGALAPKPPKAGVLAGVDAPKPPPNGEGLAAAPKAGAAGPEQQMAQHHGTSTQGGLVTQAGRHGRFVTACHGEADRAAHSSADRLAL